MISNPFKIISVEKSSQVLAWVGEGAATSSCEPFLLSTAVNSER